MADDSPTTGQPTVEQRGALSSPHGTALNQGEIDALIQNAQDLPFSSQAAAGTSPGPPRSGAVDQSDVEFLLNQAQQALASIDNPTRDLPPGVQSFEFKNFLGNSAHTEAASLELVRDVELDLKIELGRTHMRLEDVLRLRNGAVVTLDKLAGDPVDIYVNGRLIARGEVLVLNDNFCVRVAELIAGESASA